MSQVAPTPRAKRYAAKLNQDARLAAKSSKKAPAPGNTAHNQTQAPPTTTTTRGPAPQNKKQPPVVVDLTTTGSSPPTPSDSSDSSSASGSDTSDLPWSPAYPGPVPSINLLGGIQPRANTDFTVQLPWPLRLCFQWNFLRLYGTTTVAVNDGLEPDYFTGRVYGYIDRQDPNTALTVARLQAFFRLSILFHLYRLTIISAIVYRIPLTLLRYGLMQYGFFPLFEFDILARWWLNLVVLALSFWCLNFWPLNLKGHICRLMAAFLIQTAVWSYFQEQKELRDLIFQLHPVVWVSADVVWTILYQHTALPIPSASTIWYIAGLDVNPFYFFTKLYPVIVRVYARWNYCGEFGKEVQSLCFLTPEADFPTLLQGLQNPLTTTMTVTKQPTITEIMRVFYSIPKPTIVTETDTKTIFQGPITEEPILSEYITGRTSSMAYVKAFITTVAQTITETLTGKSSEVTLPDSTCPWTCSGTCATPAPEPCGE